MLLQFMMRVSVAVSEWPSMRRKDVGHSMLSNRPLQGHMSPALELFMNSQRGQKLASTTCYL